MSEADKARQALYATVTRQIESNTPPSAGKAMKRLREKGYSDEQSMGLIAAALSHEMTTVMKSGTTYNAARYAKSLERLPKLPWSKA